MTRTHLRGIEPVEILPDYDYPAESAIDRARRAICAFFWTGRGGQVVWIVGTLALTLAVGMAAGMFAAGIVGASPLAGRFVGGLVALAGWAVLLAEGDRG